jgi:hypothetical protein
MAELLPTPPPGRVHIAHSSRSASDDLDREEIGIVPDLLCNPTYRTTPDLVSLSLMRSIYASCSQPKTETEGDRTVAARCRSEGVHRRNELPRVPGLSAGGVITGGSQGGKALSFDQRPLARDHP